MYSHGYIVITDVAYTILDDQSIMPLSALLGVIMTRMSKKMARKSCQSTGYRSTYLGNWIKPCPEI